LTTCEPNILVDNSPAFLSFVATLAFIVSPILPDQLIKVIPRKEALICVATDKKLIADIVIEV